MFNLKKIQSRIANEEPWKIRMPQTKKWLFVSPNSCYRAGLKSHKWLIALEGEGCVLVDVRLPIGPFEIRKGHIPLNESILIAGLLNILFEHEDFNQALIDELSKENKTPPPPPEDDAMALPEVAENSTAGAPQLMPSAIISAEVHPGAQDDQTAQTTDTKDHANPQEKTSGS